MIGTDRRAVHVQQQQLMVCQTLHLEVEALGVQSWITSAPEVDGGTPAPQKIVIAMALDLDALQIFTFVCLAGRCRSSAPVATTESTRSCAEAGRNSVVIVIYFHAQLIKIMIVIIT